MAKREGTDDGNSETVPVSVRGIVNDAQFRSGYRDTLAGRPPRRFFYDEQLKGDRDNWGYERGRLVACFLLATGQKPPAPNDIDGLIRVYREADRAGVVL